MHIVVDRTFPESSRGTEEIAGKETFPEWKVVKPEIEDEPMVESMATEEPGTTLPLN